MTTEIERSSIRLDEESYNRKITPEMVARERSRIGEPYSPAQAHFEVASKDAIRIWAHGIGDRNPLYTDEEYAKNSVHGHIVGPPTVVGCLDRNILGNAARGFPGVHGWQLGNEYEWHRVIDVDTPVIGKTYLAGIDEVESKYAGGKAYDMDVQTELRNKNTGELLCTAGTFIRRFERSSGRKQTKYQMRDKQKYTPQEIQAIAELYEQEVKDIRGVAPRYFEDVAIGDQLPDIVRGPLSVMDCLAFVLGWGGSFIFAHGFAYDFLKDHPGAFPLNDSGVPDSPERTHWVDQFAQAIGAPAAFDYGPQRIAWCSTAVTNWMGDQGFLRNLKSRLLRPNYHGDTVWLRSKVTAVDAEASEVEIFTEGVNQLDEVVVDSTAKVRLPSRSAAQ